MKLIDNLPRKLGLQKQLDTLSQNVLELQAELAHIKNQLNAGALPQEPAEEPEESANP
ncbi:MAG: hypothetical protein HFH48_09425 [Lachnospiraceae bacterium]|nr:hypothetical protein [Lachnospiraceae bacterium]